MIAWLAKIISSVFGLKVFMSGLLMTILGVILYNLMVDVVEEVMNFALAQISGASLGEVGTPTVTGFAAWFLAQVKMPECISVLASAVALRFILRKVPFLRW